MSAVREDVKKRNLMDANTDEIDLTRIFRVLRPFIWRILAFSIAVGVVVIVASFFLPNRYRAEATVAPVAEEPQPNLSLGALAASAGIFLGGPSKVEDLESLFKSRDLAVRVFEKNSLWPMVAPDRYNTQTRTLAPSLADRLFRGAKQEKPPDAWDAILLAEDSLRVTVNRRSNTLQVSFESVSPEGAKEVLQSYLEEAKSRLQEEALGRAKKNKQFIEEQISKTVDALTRDRLYSLYGQEVEREMMARNREQFAFTVIDSPRTPVRKSGPHRALLAFFAMFIAAVVGTGFYMIREPREEDH